MFELRPLSYAHPDAQELTERAQAYYVELYGGPDDDPLTADEFADPRGGFVVGYLDDAAVAMGGWTFTASDLGDRVAKIRRMYVDASVRRRGLARAVLRHLEQEAAGHGATTIILATGQPQVAAIGFYRGHGYTDTAPFGYYAAGDQVVCLAKDLVPGPQPTS
ncbi:MAG TPA: GNAT family N-acetyltransferase [Microlunatus sp.]